MGSYKYTKIILWILILWWWDTSGLKIKAKLNDDIDAGKAYATTFYLTTGSSNENDKIMSNDMTSSFVEDVKETCETNKDSLYNRLNTPSTDYARITIYTTAEALTSNDADLMEFNDPTILNLVKNEYKRLTNVLTYQECNIFIFTDVFYVVPNANSGVIANRDKLFKDYLHLSDKFRDINKHFYIDESLTVTEVENQFYLNQNKDNIETQNHYFTTTQNTGRYTIQAAYIQVKTTKICVPNDTNDGRTSYQGVLNTDDGSSSVSLSENGYVLTVPAKADLSNLFVGKEYNTKHYNYVWEFYPYYQQMSAEYMINLLDQDISVNSKNSYVYGYNQYYEIDLIIPPPKGLASLAKFSYSKAVVKTRDDKMVNTYFDMNIPDFSFLPLEIETGSNSCNINYTDVNTVEVKIIGTTKLSSATYRSEFIKTTSIQYYTVTLYAIDGVLTFDSIRQDFLPSLETGSINILTSDQASLDNLARFQITEENTIIQNPIIEINFYEYYVYRISGSIKYGDGNGDWCSVKAELSNLDGEVLSYMRFYFPSAQSLKTYNTFFNTQDGDSGFRSLTINDFQVISSNRDFNMDKLDALRHTSIIAYSSSGVILKDGVTVFMNAQLLTDCLDYTFCRYIKKLEIPSNFNLTGLYVSKNTKLESEMVDMRLGNTFYFKNNTLQIKIGNDGSNNYSYLKVKGDMIVAVDPDTDQTFNGVWRFGKEDSSAIFVSGTSHGVYHIRRCLVPPINDRDFAKLRGGGLDKGDFYFRQTYLKKLVIKIFWVNQIFFNLLWIY